MEQMTSMFLLVKRKMLPVPEYVEIVDSFGHERVSFDGFKTHETGTVMLVRGAPDNLRKWLFKFDEIVVSDNPMISNWKKYLVEDKLPKAA